MRRKLREFAEKNGRTMAEIVRAALRMELEFNVTEMMDDIKLLLKEGEAVTGIKEIKKT